MRRIANISLGILALTWSVLPWDTLNAQQLNDPNHLISEVQIGYSGVVRLGHWVPVRIHVGPDRLPSDFQLELETTDSDAVPVVFRSRPAVDADGWIRGLICVGRINAGLSIRIVDSRGSWLASENWVRLADSYTVIPATERILLQLGSPLNLPKSATAGGLDEPRRIALEDAQLLPRLWYEYDSIDWIVLATGGTDNIAKHLEKDHREALWRWLEMGGRLLLSTGENAAELLASGGPLERFAPGEFRGTNRVSNSDSLEFYAGASAGQLITDPAIQSLLVAAFDSVAGVVEVRQNNAPLIVRRSVGFGDVVFVSFDLEQPLVAQWKGNGRLLSRLLGNAGAETGLVRAKPKTLETNYGFRDLSGQVRAAGERFRGVTIISFMLVAALIVLYAICLGPVDYLLLQRVVRRMEWTWLTSTLMVLAFAGLAWGMVRYSKPRSVLINHTEIIDLDAAGSAARGGIWTSIYSPRTNTFELAFPKRGEPEIELTTGLTAVLGLPGEGVGGMESRTVTQLFREPYFIDVSGGGDLSFTEVKGAPVAIASTKQFFSKWEGAHDASSLGDVTFQETGRQLAGTIRNPLNHDLRDALVLYGNTVYLFGDVSAGSTVDLSSGTERSLRFFLQSADSNAETARWTTGDRRISRVFDMLMFFRVAGGEDFTGLSNDFQNEFDLSEALSLGKAVFSGRVDGDSACPLTIADRGGAPKFDRQTTFLRIVLPVQVIGPKRK